jgi:hypothetical protein
MEQLSKYEKKNRIFMNKKIIRKKDEILSILK